MKSKTKKKTQKKISKREENLLLGLAIVVIVALYYYTVAGNLMGKTSALGSEIQQFQETKEQMDTVIAQSEIKQTEAEELKTEIFPIAKKYFGKTEQEEFIMQINRLNQASGLDIVSIQFSEYASISLDGEKQDNQDAGTEESNSDESNTEETDSTSEETASTDGTNTAEGQANTEKPNEQLSVDVNHLMDNKDSSESEEEVVDSNIKLMQAQIEFKGTYAQVLKLLHEIDNNPKNIISSELTMAREGDAIHGEKETKMTGNIRLSFYQVTDVDKYVQAVPGVLDTLPLPKSGRINPYLSYSWAWKKDVPASSDPLNIIPSGVRPPSDTVPNKKSNKKQTIPSGKKWGSKVSLKNKEIFGFENGDIVVKGSGPQIAVQGEITDGNFAKGSKAGRLTYAFTGNTDGEKAYIDLTSSNITIKQKVEGIGFSVYSDKELPHEVGLRMTDANGQEYLIVFAKEISWTGWKEILYDLHGIKNYPIKIDGIYVEGKKDSGALEGSLIFDNIFINVLQYE